MPAPRPNNGRPAGRPIQAEEDLVHKLGQYVAAKKLETTEDKDAAAINLQCYGDQERTNIPNLTALVELSDLLTLFLPHWPAGMAWLDDIRRVLTKVHSRVPIRPPAEGDPAWLKWLAKRILFLIAQVRFCIVYPARVHYRLQLLTDDGREVLRQMCAYLTDVDEKEPVSTATGARRRQRGRRRRALAREARDDGPTGGG